MAIRLPGHATTAAAVVVIALVLSAAYLSRAKAWSMIPLRIPLTAAAVALIAVIPFGSSGRVGVLGVATDDDMNEHLLAAWAMQGSHAGGVSKLVHSGYPVAPHALVSAIAHATGISLEHAFMGLLVAVPAMLALAGVALLSATRRPDERPSRPVLLAAIGGAAGLCYLQSAFLAQASFKEPLETVFAVAFAAGLIGATGPDRSECPLRAVPLGVLAAGALYVYSYPGMAWLGGTLIVWAVIQAARGGLRSARDWRTPALAAGVFVILVVPELPRLIDFSRSGYNRETSTVFGNLPRALPPQEALGIWPRPDFRFDLSLSSPAGIAGMVALAVLLVALVRMLRRREFVLPALFLVSAALYGVNALRSPYSAAKTLTILAPLVTLILGRELLYLLAGPRRARAWKALPIAVLGLLLSWGAYSDLEVLRDAPVGPTDHAAELAQLRSAIGHEPTLFLGADDFTHWELRGALVATPPAPLYTTFVVPLRRQKAQQDPRLRNLRGPYSTQNRFAGVGLAFDFDSIPAPMLDRFTYAILPRSGYRSAPPPNWRLLRRGHSYELWRRLGRTVPYETLTEVDNPGAVLDCATPAGRTIASRTGIAMIRPAPVVGERTAWRGRVGYAGATAHQDLTLAPGTWQISLQYDAAVPVTVSGRGLHASLPASLEPRGPYWLAGKVHVVRPRRTRLTVRYAPLPWLGELMGAFGLTRGPTPTGFSALGRITASRVPVLDHAVSLGRACGRYVDSYRSR